MKTLWSKSGRWELPEGRTFVGWTRGDTRETKFVYFWADPTGDEEGPVWYRAYPEGGRPGGWVEMLPAEDVFSKTGHEPEEPEDEDENLVVGGAEMLPAGSYHLDFKAVIDGEVLELRGIRFRVAGRDDPDGGWMLP